MLSTTSTGAILLALLVGLAVMTLACDPRVQSGTPRADLLPTASTPVEPAPPATTDLTDQPWDALTGNGWNYLRRTGSKDANIVLDPTAPVSPQRVLRIVFTPDMTRDTEPSVHWTRLASRPREVSISWAMKLSDNWSTSPAGGGKIAFLWAADGQGQVYFNIGGSRSPHRINVNTEWAPYGQKFWEPNLATTAIHYGQWYQIEWHVKWESSPGAEDGVIRWSVNGTVNGEHRNVRFPACCLQQFEFAPTRQNPPRAEEYLVHRPHPRQRGPLIRVSVMKTRICFSAALCSLILGVAATAGAQGLVDVTPPSVVITSLHAGATVPTGLILRASAADDSAVASVRFFVGSVEIVNDAGGAPDLVSWDTRDVAEGPHLLTVVARDVAGNIGSAAMLVTVDRTPPAVAITSPVDATTVSDLVTIAADASDNFAVDRVWFSANGVPLGEDATPPYAIAWDTTLIPDGSYTLKIAAADRAGGLNTTEATITLANGATFIAETDPAVSYSGTWAHGNDVRSWFGGTAAVATLTAYPPTPPCRSTGRAWRGLASAGRSRVLRMSTLTVCGSAPWISTSRRSNCRRRSSACADWRQARTS